MKAALGSICEAIVDCEHKTAPPGDGYALSVGTRAMKSGRLVVEACKPVSQRTYEGWSRRMRPEPGDLILAREAPVGQVVLVPDDRRLCLGQRTVLIRPDPSRVHQRFLHYWLLGPDAQNTMNAQAAGATVPHLNVEDIRNLDVSRLPTDPQVQLFAASALGALDDLIENNRRRIELLEQMAQAVYREWFVHFRYPGSANTSLVDSSLGPIPRHWKVERVEAIAAPTRNAVAGGPFGSKLGRKDYVDVGVPVIRGANLRVGGGFDETQLVFVSDEKAEDLRSALAARGDVLITQRGTLGQVGLIPAWSDFDRYVLSQSQMKITVDPSKVSAEFIYGQFSTPETTGRFISQGMSSGVPHVNLKLLREFEILVPPLHLQSRFSDSVGQLSIHEGKLLAQRDQLATIRDLLLPRLVTGQIDVSSLDLDALTESVA